MAKVHLFFNRGITQIGCIYTNFAEFIGYLQIIIPFFLNFPIFIVPLPHDEEDPES
jgi:hypothetical protein